MEIYDVIIIGAGPAGLFAAVNCAAGGLKTCITESNRSAGRKLLITGQGMCNITNALETEDFITHYGDRKRFVRKCIYGFSNASLLDFFTANGLKLEARDDGKIFPESRKASDVLNLLLSLCRKADVDIRYSSKITGAEYNPQNECFILTHDNGSAERQLNCRRLIIASGGFTMPSTGSDGSGYRLAEALGHSIVKPRVSLAGLTIAPEDFQSFAGCAGISLDCSIELYRNDRKINSYEGSLLFTHKGLSGPLIIDNSRDILPGDRIFINLLRGLNYDTASSAFLDFISAGGGRSIKSFFTGCGLPDRLAATVIAASGLQDKPAVKAAELKAASRKKLLRAFTALPFTVSRLDGRSKAMCTAGGVDVSEINQATMESRLRPGLYFAGEVMNVDGDSGGFNLQFAFSSAYAAAAAAVSAAASTE